jgi:hypothetical protein
LNLLYSLENGCLRVRGLPSEWQVFLKPKPYALSKLPGKRWKPEDPDFRIVFPPGENQDPAIHEFTAGIPADFRRIVEPFQSHQWRLLRLINEGRVPFELAQSNPLLAYCVANSHEFCADAEESISVLAWYCRKKQKELLDWLGFPGMPSTVRLFQKILPEAVHPSLLRILRDMMRRGPLQAAIGHLKKINAGVLWLLVTGRNPDLPAVGSVPGAARDVELLCEARSLLGLDPFGGLAIPTGFDPATRGRLAADYNRRTAEQRRNVAPRWETPAFPAVDQCINQNPPWEAREDAFNRLIAEYECAIEKQRRKQPPLPGPPEDHLGIPPIAGTDNIIPITTAQELVREGVRMHNCVAKYRGRIEAGAMYVYRVIYPERATLAITPVGRGRWCISQIKGVCNVDVKCKTRSLVRAWVNQHNENCKKQLLVKGKSDGSKPGRKHGRTD